MVKNWLVLILFLIPSVLPAQQRIGNFMAWGRDNGLPPSLYFSVFQSSDGYLWIGSSSGLVRFDGKRFKTFISDPNDPNSPSDNEISDFAEDDQGNLWICGTIQGVTRYNLKTGRFRRYTKLSQDKLPGYGVHRVIKDDSGTLWFATDGRGLARYLPQKDSFQIYVVDPAKPHDGTDRESNHITGLVQDKNDRNLLWLSCFDGLFSFHKKTGRFTKYPMVTAANPKGEILFMSIEADQQHTIWLGTWFNGLVSLNTKTKVFTTYKLPGTPKNGIDYAVPDLRQLNDSIIYIASFNRGLLSFNKNTHRFDTLLVTEQLPQGSSGIDIQRVSITPGAGVFAGGNYYIYQEHKAFNRLGQYLAFNQQFKVEHAPKIDLTAVAYDAKKQGYWMSCWHSRAIHFFDKDLQQQEQFPADVPGGIGHRDVAVDNLQQVWAVSARGGLMKLHASGQFKQVKDVFEKDSVALQVRQVEKGRGNDLWLTTRKMLLRYDISTHRLQSFRFDKLVSTTPLFKYIYLQVDTTGNAWVYTDRGLFFTDAATFTTKLIVPGNSGLANAAIKSMTLDRNGHPWLGFHFSGLQVMHAQQHKVLTTHTMNEGMPGMQVNSLACDTAGRIWAGFAAGLAMFDPKVKVWQLFNRNDGIMRDYTDGDIFATEDGRVFLTQPDGFIHFRDEMYKASNAPPVLHITSVKVNGNTLFAPLPQDFDQTLELPYRTSEISIEYAAMDWLYPLRTKYFYRVENIHGANDWIANDVATITLAGLRPGKYVVHIYAVNGGGIKTAEMLLPITIDAPFWMRWWFLAICTLVFLSIIYLLYKYRIRQLKKLQDMRNTISRNLHDDIGASLSNINILNELVSRNLHNKEKAGTYLVKAGEDIQRISESLSDIVWNISPRYDELDNLFVRMKRYAADMLDGKNISAELFFPEQHRAGVTMPMDQRRDFYLIFKEAVNNLAKYSGATKAAITITLTPKQISLVVEDNGKGFLTAQTSYGNGIQNMMQRAAAWNAPLTIRSSPGSGTIIRLDMQLH